MSDPIFLRACRGEAVPMTPVWLMRQAGRYMKEYRDVRAKVSFLDLCKTPALASEVTVTAVRRIGADAAIIFADILLLPEAMGMKLEFTDGAGPVFHNPVREAADVERLRAFDSEELGFVHEAVRLTARELGHATPVIGFAGAPFTLAAYMIEGGSSRHFSKVKAFMHRDPGAWRLLMEKLSAPLISYLEGQVAAGARAVQLFDSWVGCLPPADYREHVLPHVKRIVREVKKSAPVIYFGVGTAALLHDMCEAGADVLGLDFHVELGKAWDSLGPGARVQGNLDPCVLLGDHALIRRKTEEILKEAGRRPGHIFNLGHGILPETPVENAIALVDAVHEISSRIRA